MKYFMIVGVLILTISTLIACSNSVKTSSLTKSVDYENISPKEAKERLESEDDIILLDVRTVEEYEEGHIPEATLIPLSILESEVEDIIQDKEVPIFVYCRSGRRSLEAVKLLSRLGYKDLYNLGGIIDWPYDIEK